MKLICGPMATVSHPAHRILIEKFGGCDEYFTEMINAGSLLTEGPFEKYYINPLPVPDKVVWQLTGRDCENMAAATELLLKLPGIGVDINMGCSAPDTYKTGAGIGWMLKPVQETREMVKQIGQVIQNYNNQNQDKKRFSVKLRLGDDNFKEDDFYSFCDMLVGNGVKVLTLHPRTKKEKLARPARYFYCENLCRRYKNNDVQIYLNGNVKDTASYENALSNAPSVSGVMVSRAAVQKPWIFAELKNFSKKEIDMLQLSLDFINDIEQFQPKDFWKTRLQRFFTYFSDNFKFAHYAKTQFLNASDNDDLRNRLKAFFEQCPEERFVIKPGR